MPGDLGELWRIDRAAGVLLANVRALAAALVHFAGETGSVITAEGVETVGELAALRELGIPNGQGYLFARPGPLDIESDAVNLTAPTQSEVLSPR